MKSISTCNIITRYTSISNSFTFPPDVHCTHPTRCAVHLFHKALSVSGAVNFIGNYSTLGRRMQLLLSDSAHVGVFVCFWISQLHRPLQWTWPLSSLHLCSSSIPLLYEVQFFSCVSNFSQLQQTNWSAFRPRMWFTFESDVVHLRPIWKCENLAQQRR